MERPVATRAAARAYDLGAIASDRRFQLGDWSHEAEPLLVKLWSLANGSYQELADILAWETGWLLVQRGNLADAATWFGRVSLLPGYEAGQWSITKSDILESCRAKADRTDVQRSLRCATPVHVPETYVTQSAPEFVPLVVQSLGTFQVHRGKTVLMPSGNRKATAAFRYLLTKPYYRAGRDELVDMLWPDSRSREAMHRLHVAISALRRCLDSGRISYITFESGCYGINPAVQIVDDVRIFAGHGAAAVRYWHSGDLEQALEEYRAAIDSYHGDFSTEDVTMDWAVAERERLLSCYLIAHEQVGQIYVAQERWEDAVPYLERALASDWYREDLCERLMLCHERLGRRSAALSTFARCARALKHDLGLAPTPSLHALYLRIKTGTASRVEMPLVDANQYRQVRELSRPNARS